MKNFQLFIQDFIKNKGLLVMFSLFIAKISAFLTQLIVIRLLPKEEFGTIAYFLSFLVFFLPFSGFGTYQGLVKFGSNSDDYGYKKRLFQYSFFAP